MLIIALVLAVVGLAALVAAVVTSNELIAWVCIGASVLGVLLLIADALRSRREGDPDSDADDAAEDEQVVEDYPEEPAVTESEAFEAGATENRTETEEVTGVTDTDADTPADADSSDGDSPDDDGGAVDISPDPEETPKS